MRDMVLRRTVRYSTFLEGRGGVCFLLGGERAVTILRVHIVICGRMSTKSGVYYYYYYYYYYYFFLFL
jgi:hypothetical protein